MNGLGVANAFSGEEAGDAGLLEKTGENGALLFHVGEIGVAPDGIKPANEALLRPQLKRTRLPPNRVPFNWEIACSADWR
jgi:hypothetical protein